ncbi:hypothetical protein EXS70_04905 [Candidatus Peribacteria bacterium]|nr:hypothetical protein [Candidatus Peribacteria bacterium]
MPKNKAKTKVSPVWFLLVIGCAVAFALIIQIPQWLHQMDPRAAGVLVQLNSDEDVYLARVEESLTGRPVQTAEAIVGDPALRGSQPALLEQVTGVLFSWTHWRAVSVLQLMDSVSVFLLFLCLVWFLRQCGFPRMVALVGTVFFCVIQLYNLNRPIHQGLSLVLLLAALDFLMAGRERRIFWGIPGAVLLGALFGDYFWNWSFGLAWVGILILFDLVECATSRRCSLAFKKSAPLLALALACSVPFLLQMISIMTDPLASEAVFRSGMHPGRLPESWVYSVLFAVMAGGVLFAFWQQPKKLRPYRYGIVTVLTAFVVIHQQLLHGYVFNFVSHYLMPMVIAAIITLSLWHFLRNRALLAAALAALVYLTAVAYDGRNVASQFRIADRFGEQHLGSALAKLDELPRTTILSDPGTSAFIAGSTQHNVVYSLYLKNVLMAHTEIAERYCATVVPLKSVDRHLKDQELIWPDADGAFHSDPSVREREVAMVEEACRKTDNKPRAALQKFHVQYVLWDEKRQPTWDLRRLRVVLNKVAVGEGWSLWSLK